MWPWLLLGSLYFCYNIAIPKSGIQNPTKPNDSQVLWSLDILQLTLKEKKSPLGVSSGQQRRSPKEHCQISERKKIQ
jgi:ABC-type ATPase involved in cell division